MARRAALRRDDDYEERPRRDRDDRRSGRGNSGKRFHYQQRSSDDVRARAEQTGGSYDSFLLPGFDSFRAKEGENIIRFLPATWDNAKHYGYDVWVHAYVGMDSSTYLCLDKMKKERCPICAAAKEARDAGDEDEYKALKVRQRVLAWILDRNADDDKPLVYDMSWSMDREIAELSDVKRQGTLYIDHQDEGYDVSFKRKGTKLNTRYIGIQIDRVATPILESQRKQDEVLDFIQDNPIPSILKFHPAEYLEKVMEGASDQRDVDLDEEENDRDRRPRRRDEDDYEPRRGRGWDRDEEEEEPPRRSSRDRDEEERPRSRDRDEEETRAPRGRRDRDEEEDEPRRPSRTSRYRDEEEEPEERPARRVRPRDADDDKPSGRRRVPIDDRRRRDHDEEEAGERPRARGRRVDLDDEIPF